jgi:hypothetical protein
MDGKYAKSTVDESLTAFKAREVLNWRVKLDLCEWGGVSAYPYNRGKRATKRMRSYSAAALPLILLMAILKARD